VLSDIGSFGGLYDGAGLGHAPVLVASMDGVGTKLAIARATGRWESVGEDLVHHSVNDILVQGARPLFFLDYIGAGKLERDAALGMVRGMARACARHSCALLGGETAEMPGTYATGDYDLVGCIIGVAERDQLLTGEAVRAGDEVWGLASTGLHTNGYSLARRVLFESARARPRSRPSGVGDLARRCVARRAPFLLRHVVAARAGSAASTPWRTSPAGDWSRTSRASCPRTVASRSMPRPGRCRRSSG
jgi:phosphoribosylformylglycinamidine cyclo-ligase